MNDLKIRKLTPKECWRLMGFDDEDFEKAEKVNSNTQLYKQAGNSIVVNVLERILENLLDKNEHIKILELFGGIGACSKALERVGINYEIADYVEIDKYAVKSFNAIHNSNFEPQDICEWDKNVECDLIMHGSPCQDFSSAGKQAGGDKGSGTRSSLMYETIRIIEKLKPKYVIWENVKNLLSKKHRHNFDNYFERMEELGYQNYYQVLNAKDYGIPQNRERVFTISIRNDITKSFEFPPKQELKLKLKDMLEDNVDEKYYLSEKIVNFFYKNEEIQKEKGNGFRFGVSNGNVIAKAITTRAGSRMDDNFLRIKNNTKKGYLEATDDGIDISQPNSETNNFVVNKINKFLNKNGYVPDMFNPYNEKEIEDLAPTQTTTCGSTTSSSTILIKNATKRGYLEATDGDGIDISSRMQYHKGTVQKDMCQTITTSGGNDRGVVIKEEYDFSDLD